MKVSNLVTICVYNYNIIGYIPSVDNNVIVSLIIAQWKVALGPSRTKTLKVTIYDGIDPTTSCMSYQFRHPAIEWLALISELKG